MLHFWGHQRLGKNKENTKSETNARRSASFSFNALHLDWVLLCRLFLLLTSKKFKKMMPIPWGVLSKVIVAFFAGNVFARVEKSVKFCNSYLMNR